jgi:hypothetical protein
LVNDADVQGDVDVDRLREIHIEIDEALVAAYGWEDLPLHHGFHAYRQVERWGPSAGARTDLLDRLLGANHSRAASQPDGGVKSPARVLQAEGTLFS